MSDLQLAPSQPLPVHWPDGRQLVSAYKKTGAIPDYEVYWQQNGHVHACAVGVLVGAIGGVDAVNNAWNSVYSGGFPLYREAKYSGEAIHAVLAHQLKMPAPTLGELTLGATNPVDLVYCYEAGVRASDAGLDPIKVMNKEEHHPNYSFLHERAKFDTEEEVEAFLAGYQAWSYVKMAQQLGWLPKHEEENDEEESE